VSALGMAAVGGGFVDVIGHAVAGLDGAHVLAAVGVGGGFDLHAGHDVVGLGLGLWRRRHARAACWGYSGARPVTDDLLGQGAGACELAG
jgi:hypothetical protein